MSDEQPKTPQTSSGWAADFRKQVPVLAMVILTSLAASWWQSQKVQGDLLHRVEQVELKSETNAKNIALNADINQQNAIKLAEIGAYQKTGLDQLADLKQQVGELRAQLQRR